jgi:ribosomal protein L37AE/L43A
MAQLTEEVGEVARIIARRYGEQSEKESDKGEGPRRRAQRCSFCSALF